MPKIHKNLQILFTSKSLSHFGGLYLLQQFFQKFKLRSLISRAMQPRQRNTRYTISDSLLSLLYPLVLGFNRIETTFLLKRNNVFHYITGLSVYPNPTTIRRFVRRFAEENLNSFMKLHDQLRTYFLQLSSAPSSVIFDLDTTVLTVFGHQEGAKVGFNPKKRGRPSYQPLLCFEGKTKDCWEGEFLSGNIHPASVAVSFLERCFQKLPSFVREIRVRGDAAFYDHEIIEFIGSKRSHFTLAARITKPMQNILRGLKYRAISPRLSVAEFEYQPWRWKQSQRFVVIRRPLPEEPSWQLSLFKMGDYTYRVIVTNLSLEPLNLWRFYNLRSTIELIIRQLIEAYALSKIPTREFITNIGYFQVVLFSYNLLNWFKRLCLPSEWQNLTLQTIRNRLLLIPAEFVRPEGTATLKMPNSFPYQKEFLQTLKNIERLKLNKIV